MFKFLLLGLGFMLYGCASHNYSERKINNNNSVFLKTNRPNYFHLKAKNLKKEDPLSKLLYFPRHDDSLGNLCYQLVIDKLSKKNLSLTLTNNVLDTIHLKLTRIPRTEALIKDIALSLFTLGIPLIIDLQKPEFYKLSKKSRVTHVELNFKQTYMSGEYDKISNSTNVNDFQNWLNLYTYSHIHNKVLNHKDSLEMYQAIAKESEEAINDFINTHKESIYLNKAMVLKKEMENARISFANAKEQNTVDSYETFLFNFPQSLHNSEAHRLLVFAYEKYALNSGSVNLMIKYVNNYLKSNKFYFNTDELSKLNNDFSKGLDDMIIKENIIPSDPSEKYEAYSKLWKQYIHVLSQTPTELLNDLIKTKSNRIQISNLIFEKIKQIDTYEKQLNLVSSINNDFPNLNIENENVILTILKHAENISGFVKLFDVNFLEYYFHEKITEGDRFIGYDSYYYKTKEYKSLQNITSEEITFHNGEIAGKTRAYNNSNIVFSINCSQSNVNEIQYYQNGKLVKTIFFEGNQSSYNYEFENEINLTLQNLNQQIEIGDNFMKEGQNAQVELDKAGFFAQAQNTYTNALKNNFPTTLKENIKLKEKLKNASDKRNDCLAIVQKKTDDRKRELQEIRNKEEKRQEEEAQKRRETQKNNSDEETNESVLSEEDAQTLLFVKLVGGYESNDGNWIALYANKTGKLRIEDNFMGLGLLVFTWAISGESLSIKFQNEYGINQTVFLSLIPRGSIYDLKYRTMTGGIQFIKTR